MSKKGTKLYSIFNNKCPRCQIGNVYEDSNPYHLKKLFKMHKNCSKCNLKYEMEPSFFHGAMYVSYALTVAVFVVVFIVTYLLGIGLIFSFLLIMFVIIVLMPVTFKLSRLIYLNFFVSYKNFLEAKESD